MITLDYAFYFNINFHCPAGLTVIPEGGKTRADLAEQQNRAECKYKSLTSVTCFLLKY